jgi:glycosyltransferase involved in cell wall biosynthesis
MHNLNKRKVLFIDHESGHGGSSISLYNKIKLISKENYEITVVLREKSFISKKYKEINVKIIYLKIPTITSLAKTIPNIMYFIKFSVTFFIFNFKNRKFYSSLNIYDNIHLNHENLYWLLKHIKKKTKSKISMSIRTILKKSLFSKLQSNIINNFADKKLFISEINQKKFNELVRYKKKNNFILENFSLQTNKQNKFNTRKKFKEKFTIVSISNYSHDRGLDRIVDIAKKFNDKNYKKINFSFIGDYKIKSLKNFIFKDPRKNLKTLAKKNNLKNIKFYGHKKNIYKYLREASILLYLPRTDSSWGRNIIEALNFGIPVVTCGNSNILIENNINGYFFKKYEIIKVFSYIEYLYHNRNEVSRMSIEAKQISSKKYNTYKIKKKLVDFIEN